MSNSMRMYNFLREVESIGCMNVHGVLKEGIENNPAFGSLIMTEEEFGDVICAYLESSDYKKEADSVFIKLLYNGEVA